VLVVLTVAIFGWQAWRTAQALAKAEELAPSLQSALARGDVERARARLDEFDDATAEAHDRSDGVLWWLATRVPWLGRNAEAVSTVARELDRIAIEALPRFVNVADEVRLETFRPKDGRIDLAAVARTLPVLLDTRAVMLDAERGVDKIAPGRLMRPLQQPVGEFQHRVRQVASAVSSVSDVATLMPDMLGGGGTERRYLLLVLNNAEVRSLAGMPGSVAVITAKNGRLDIGQQGGIKDLPPLDDDETPLDIAPELTGGFPSTVGTDIRDAAILPDFPRVARLTAGIVGRHWDEDFDGVFALDPVSLGYILAGLGPVDIGDDLELTQHSAVPTLLSEVYLKYAADPDQQDAVFERAARQIFDAMTDGEGDSVETMRGLARGVHERRIMLWSKDPEEQKRIRRSGISATLSQTDRRRPEVGFFVNDGASSKMEFYLRMGSRVRAVKCHGDGSQTLRFSTVLRSEAPQSVRTLPPSVTGTGEYVDQGIMRLHTLIAAPPGGKITRMWVDGRRESGGADSYMGRHLARAARQIPPGRSVVVTAEIETAPGADGAPRLRTTPGVETNNDTAGPSACQ
jgi:hypothetical protein